MKKKFIGVPIIAAALALPAGMTASAGWIQDGNGWYYQNADGSFPRTASWFTDPDTGLEYFLDPDGYMMAGTHMDGFWLDDNGVKQEKTQAQMEAEAARAERAASRPSPAKARIDANNAAQAAKTASAAASTIRLSYQAEMKTFMDTVFNGIRDQFIAKGTTAITGSTFEDNLENTYYYQHNSMGRLLTCTIWKSSNEKSKSYTPYAFEMTYNRGATDNAEDMVIVDGGVSKLLTAALGENEGKVVSDAIFAEAVGNGASFNRSGNTDTGNSYELTFQNDQTNLKVICSEVVPETTDTAETTDAAEAADGTEDTENADTAGNTEAEQGTGDTASQSASASPVIVSGQGASAASEEDGTAEETETNEKTTEDSDDAGTGSQEV